MKRLEFIFWDNDGIFVDTENLYFQATQEVFKNNGHYLTKEQYITLNLVEGKSPFDMLARQHQFSESQINNFRKKRDQIYSEYLKNYCPIIEGVEEVLLFLKDKVKMAVVTSSKQEHFDLIHGQTGYLKYFDFTLTRNDYDRSKPHPDPYLKALEISNTKSDQCIVIEDSQRGLESAKLAGLKCFIIPTELTFQSDFSTADGVFQSALGLKEYLMNNVL